MDSYGRSQGGSTMKCWMCVSNQVASYIIAAITLILIIVGLAIAAADLNTELKDDNTTDNKIAVCAIMIVKNLLMIIPALLLIAAINKGKSNWFYPALLGYLLYVVLTIADVVVHFSTSDGFAGGKIAYVILSILIPIYFFIVVNYYKREVVQMENRVGAQSFNPRGRY